MEFRLVHVVLLSAMAASCLVVTGAPSRSPTPAEESANRYIDLVLENLGPHLRENNMDPLPLDDLVIGFSQKILLITVHGSIGLTDGRMYGLSTMHRTGDCSIETQENKLIVDAKIGVNDIWGAFNGHAQFMGIGVNAKLSLAVDRVTVDARISASLGSGASPDLDKFSISSLSAITVRFSGLGPLDWIINPVTNVLVNVVRGVLVKVIEIFVRAQVKKVLQSIQLPLLA